MSKKGKRCMSEGGKVAGKAAPLSLPPNVPANATTVKGSPALRKMKQRTVGKK